MSNPQQIDELLIFDHKTRCLQAILRFNSHSDREKGSRRDNDKFEENAQNYQKCRHLRKVRLKSELPSSRICSNNAQPHKI